MTFQQKLVSVFGAAVLILVSVGTFSYRWALQENQDQSRVAHTHLVLDRLDAVLIDLVDAETGQRGYIITGEDSYLAPYQSALGRLHDAVGSLRNLTADNPREQLSVGRLDPLIAAKLAELQDTIGVREREGMAAGMAAVRTDTGKQLMDQIRVLISEMRTVEQRLLTQRSEAADAASRKIKALVVVGNLLALSFLLLSVLVIRQEMNKRKRAEDRFHGLLESAPDANVIVDHAGRIDLVNVQTEKMFGYRREELLGQPVEILLPEHLRRAHLGHRRDYSAKPHARPMGAGMELYGRRKDGSQFPVEISLSPLQTVEGILISSSIRDITSRKLAEQEIQKLNIDLKNRVAELAALNQELEAFCYSVSHDLRAPLRGIDGFSQALLEDYADQIDPQGKHYLQRVRAGAQRMAILIDDLLNLSHITRVEIKHQAIDLSKLAHEVEVALRSEEPERKVDFVIAPELPAQADLHLMQVVLENLLRNAWKFTSKRDHARIELGRIQDNGSSAYFVRDNGAGFNPAYVDRLFGAFQRLHAMTEFPGTGVGLATVQRIIRRHGGRVWAEGAVDRGATFYFTL